MSAPTADDIRRRFHIHFGIIRDQKDKRIKPEEIVDFFVKQMGYNDKPSLTLQQCKDAVAQKRYGGKNWEEFKSDNPTVVFMEQLMDEVFELGMQSNKGG